jgi:SSS family solute:Na+ symporter
MTLSEEISSFYGGNRYVYEYINITLFISQVFWMTVQIMGGGFMLSVILGLHPNKCMIIAGILIASTSLPGGLMTVVFTDVLQAIILIIGFCILTAVTLGETGGLAALHNMVPEGYVSFMGVDEIGWAGALSIFLALGLSIVADPGRRLILYGGKTVKGGRRAMIGAGLIEIAFSPLVVIAGMYAYSLNPDLLEQDQALPWLITDILPTWLAAILVVSITAAVFSSGNTNGATSCTYFMRHIYPLIMGRYPKRPLMVSRLVLLGVIIVSTVMALYAGTIVSFVADFLSALMSGPAIIVLVGRFWRRATWQGALAGLIATLIVSIFVIVIPSLREYFVRPVIPAAVVGLVTEIIVSLITPRNQIQFEDVVTKMSDQRIGIDDYEGD